MCMANKMMHAWSLLCWHQLLAREKSLAAAEKLLKEREVAVSRHSHDKGAAGNRLYGGTNNNKAAEDDDGRKLIFADEFDSFDLSTWKHEITMAGGGNWEVSS